MPKLSKSESDLGPEGKANANPNGAAMTKADTYPLDTIADYKWWYKHKPNASKLLKEIIYQWRRSSARVPGISGKWAVYARSEWQDWVKLSRNQLDRALKHLDDMGLIERERHQFGGTTVHTYIRPTQLALNYAGRPSETVQGSVLGSVQTEAGENTDEKIDEKTGEKTDPTKKIYLSKKSTSLQKSDLDLKEQGKGRGEAGKPSSPGKLTPPIPPSQPAAADCLPGPYDPPAHPSEVFDSWDELAPDVKAKAEEKHAKKLATYNKSYAQAGVAVPPC